MSKIKNFYWSFGEAQKDRRKGWNDSGIAGFKGNRLEALVREIIQNSMDAWLDKDKEEKDRKNKVVVYFQDRRMSEARIPDLDTLKGVLGECSRSAKGRAGWIKEEIEAAIADANHPKGIRVLSIKDTGTKGMRGPCIDGMPFHRYLKTNGDPHDEEDRGGSHGIGKMAPLCSTNMRSIFISTLWEDKGKFHGLIAGHANLMSHVSEDGLHEGVGGWGEDGEPIEREKCPEEYDWLRRKDKDGTGTTIHILGWSPRKENWSDIILGYVAINFFAAVERGKLEVCISQENGEKKTINKENIRGIFDDDKIRNAMSEESREETEEKADNLKKFEDSQFFHKCIAEDEEVETVTHTLEHFGRSTLRIWVESEVLEEKEERKAPREIAIIRNDMLITTHFDGFERTVFRSCRGYAGVFECDVKGKNDRAGNSLLRSMEPPAHNALKPDNTHSLGAEKNAQKALRLLAKHLRKMIYELASYKDFSSTVIGIMTRYLSDDGTDVDMDVDTPFDPELGYIILPSKRKISREPSDEPPEPRPDSPKRVKLLKRRAIFKKGESFVRVVIESTTDQKGYLLIDEVGEEGKEFFMMKEMKDKLGNMVRKYPVDLQAGKSVSLDLSLSRKIIGGLRLFVIENEGEVQ